jgi:hypothetical protein
MNFDNYVDDQYIWDSQAFPQQSNPSEDIVLVVRQDIAVLIIRLIATLFVFSVFLLVRFLGGYILPANMTLAINLLNFFISLGSLVLLLSFLRFFHNFYLSIQLVTNDRVIDIDQKGIFRREVNELAMSNVQEVTHRQNGIFQSLLGYGEVVIKTASTEQGTNADSSVNGFVFENCPEPSRVAGIISDLYHKHNSESVRKDAVVSAEELKKVINDVVNKPNDIPQVKQDIPQAPDDLDMSNFSF